MQLVHLLLVQSFSSRAATWVMVLVCCTIVGMRRSGWVSVWTQFPLQHVQHQRCLLYAAELRYISAVSLPCWLQRTLLLVLLHLLLLLLLLRPCRRLLLLLLLLLLVKLLLLAD
jgi:hypothetical protein